VIGGDSGQIDTGRMVRKLGVSRAITSVVPSTENGTIIATTRWGGRAAARARPAT
jgi:hypothetical protein